MSKVTAREVINFFEDADFELASLVLEFGNKEVGERAEKRQEAGQRMAKARAGRGKGKKAAASTPPAAVATVPAPPISSPLETARIRAGRVPAPAHTAAATSVESDSEMASA